MAAIPRTSIIGLEMASIASDEELKLVSLYGGAFACKLPSAFQDVSSVREVPDNQEVWVHSSRDQSIIIELVELQDIPDDQAARYHYQDLADSNGSTPDETSVISVTPLPTHQLALAECSTGWLLTGSQSVTKFNSTTKGSVKILLALLRVPQYTTDILVSFSCPSELGTDKDTDIFLAVVNSIKLVNSSIFG